LINESNKDIWDKIKELLGYEPNAGMSLHQIAEETWLKITDISSNLSLSNEEILQLIKVSDYLDQLVNTIAIDAKEEENETEEVILKPMVDDILLKADKNLKEARNLIDIDPDEGEDLEKLAMINKNSIQMLKEIDDLLYKSDLQNKQLINQKKDVKMIMDEIHKEVQEDLNDEMMNFRPENNAPLDQWEKQYQDIRKFPNDFIDNLINEDEFESEVINRIKYCIKENNLIEALEWLNDLLYEKYSNTFTDMTNWDLFIFGAELFTREAKFIMEWGLDLSQLATNIYYYSDFYIDWIDFFRKHRNWKELIEPNSKLCRLLIILSRSIKNLSSIIAIDNDSIPTFMELINNEYSSEFTRSSSLFKTV
jgi:hypothetical protein